VKDTRADEQSAAIHGWPERRQAEAFALAARTPGSVCSTIERSV
jgi:hypothetical protein